MTPQEKSRELAEAMKFCLEKGLITSEEVKAAQSKEQKFQLACRARLRMELYLKEQARIGKKVEAFQTELKKLKAQQKD